MKELISKFKKLDKTRKIVITFITISFISIFSIATFHSLSDDQQQDNIQKEKIVKEEKTKNKDDKVTIQSENTNEKINKTETNEDHKDETSTSTDNKKSNEKQTTDTTTKNEQTNQKQDNSQQSNNQNNKVEEIPQKEILKISISVQGMGNTMMSGQLQVEKGATAYSVLKQLASQKGQTVSGSQYYVSGIGDLKEKEHGPMSGWMYKVNGVSPNKAACNYVLNQGDSVLWYYVNYE